MKFFQANIIVSFFLGLAIAAPAPDNRNEEHIEDSDSFGGPHGDWFDDKPQPTAGHKRIAYVTFYGCGPGEHVTLMETGWRDNHVANPVVTSYTYHGGQSELKTLTLTLKPDEWINAVKVSSWKRKIRYGVAWDVRTRIGNIQLWTNKGNTVSCGAFWRDDSTVTWKRKDGKGALLYFTGRAGNSIDQIQAHWIPEAAF